MIKKIFLLTGPTNSGKSTRLMEWAQRQNNIVGIICLRDRGKRELYSIHSNKYHEYEVHNEDEPVFKIGNYKFSKESFEWAEQEILKALEIKPQWLIIDEIGPLELQGSGFDNVIKQLFTKPELSGTNLLLVIREKLVDKVVSNYNINTDKIEYVDFISKD